MTDASHVAMGAGEEFDAIRAMIAVWGAQAKGIGDDAAVLEIPPGEQLVASTDAAIEGIHFRREWLTPTEIGGRAAAAALSDLAAMAAVPRGLLLALAVPKSWRHALSELARGVGNAAAAAGCPIVGGNVSNASELTLTCTVLGSTKEPLRRLGAQAGDVLFVTGALGGPGAALRSLLAGTTPEPGHRLRFAAPVARIREAQWLASRGARAGIDISDGLLADATHLAHASRVSLAIDVASVPRVPGVSARDALSSGEEFELLVAVPPDRASQIDAAAFQRQFGIALAAIGRVRAGGAGEVAIDGLDAAPPGGHDHFA